jgi:hypothetical protein
MPESSKPLYQRGPEAFQRLLAGDDEGAREQLRLLTRSELGLVTVAAKRLAVTAVNVVCDTWPNAEDSPGMG